MMISTSYMTMVMTMQEELDFCWCGFPINFLFKSPNHIIVALKIATKCAFLGLMSIFVVDFFFFRRINIYNNRVEDNFF